MVQKVKKLISIILTLAIIMSGTLILPPQGLAAENYKTVSGSISLPSGVQAPLEGFEGAVYLEPEHGGTNYSSDFFIPATDLSTNYTVTVPVEALNTKYRVRYYSSKTYPGYVGNGYYTSLHGTTGDREAATLIDLSNINATGIDFTIYTGPTISGTIALPIGSPPIGGLAGNVYVMSDKGNEYYFAEFDISENAYEEKYEITVPEATSDTDYRVEYSFYDNHDGFVSSGYYSVSGTTSDYNSATLVNAGGGNISEIDLEIYTGNTISGTIALPEGVFAPAGGIEGNIDIYSQNGEGNYSFYFEIAEDENYVEYSITVPVDVGECRVSYYLSDDASEYLKEGYYSISGTTINYHYATIVDADDEDIEGIDLTIFPGRTITGSVALPAGESAPAGGLEGSISIWSQNEYYGTNFSISEGESSANYSVTVPIPGTSITNYYVNYNLYENYSGYLRSGYYSTGTTTPNYNSATSVNVSLGNKTGVNFTLLTGTVIAGTISLPGLEKAPSGGIEGNIYYTPVNGGSSYRSSFDILAEDSFADYTVTVPNEFLNSEYRVSYYLNDNYIGYLEGEAYYSIAGTTTNYSQATLINLSEGTVLNIPLLKGTIISGAISLPGLEKAPSGGIEGHIYLWPVNGGAGYNTNFNIISGESSVDYTVTVPTDSNTAYIVSYSFNDSYLDYLDGFYSSVGTTVDYDSRTPVNVSAGGVSGINLTILKGVSISGTISLPGAEKAPAGGLEGFVSVSLPNNEDVEYEAEFIIPAQGSSVTYTVTIPENVLSAGYIVSYYLDNNLSGYLDSGYYSAIKTTAEYDAATPVNVSTIDISGIDLTLLTPAVIVDDHGNNIASATEISLGTSISGLINPATDIDYFKFTPSHSGSYNLTTISDYDTYGYLLDNNGDIMIENNDSSGGVDNNFLIIHDLLADHDYYIGVKMYYTSDTGSYQLSVIETPAVIIPVTGVTLNDSDFTLNVGQTEQLGATIMPDNATDPSVTWTVSDVIGSNVATVSATGLVRALNEGSAVIRVTSNADTSKYAEVNVSVVNRTTISGTISLPGADKAPAGGLEGHVFMMPSGSSGDEYEAEFFIPGGESTADYTISVPVDTSISGYFMEYSLYGNFGGYQGYGYYSEDGTTSDFELATSINVNLGDMSGVNFTLLTPTVIPDDHGNTTASASVISAGINQQGLIDPAGDVDVFKFTPTQSGYYSFTTVSDFDTYGSLLSDDGSVLIDNNDGGVGGNFLITRSLQAGENYYIKVRLSSSTDTGSYQIGVTAIAEVPVTALYMNQSNATLYKGQKLQLNYNLYPYNATDRTVTWSVFSQSGVEIATVDGGMVTAKNVGTAVIRVTSNADSTKYAEANVRVTNPTTISGTISLPAGATAPLGGTGGGVYVYPASGGNSIASINFDIPEYGNSATYSVTVPENVAGSGYHVKYGLNYNYSGYAYQGYYSTEGITPYESSTLVDVSHGSAETVHMTILTKNTIEGTISLPDDARAPVGGIVGWIYTDCRDDYYSMPFSIPAGSNATTFSRELPAYMQGYKVYYYLSNYYSGYLGSGYFSTNGTTTSASASTLVNIGTGDNKAVNLTLLTGTVISGTVELPENVTAPANGVAGSVYIQSQNTSSSASFNIPSGQHSATYNLTFPKDPSIEYRVSYNLYNNEDYLNEGYYSSNGTTNFNLATIIKLNQGNRTDINLTILTGRIISGTFSLPAPAPEDGIYGYINLWSDYAGRGYSSYFDIPKGESSATYTFHVPEDASIPGYEVNYRLNSISSDYVRVGYYSPTVTTTQSKASLVSVIAGNATGINLTPLSGHTISGRISLPNGVLAAQEIQGALYISSPRDNDSSSSGGGGGGGAAVAGTVGTDNEDGSSYYLGFKILAGANSAEYTSEVIPSDDTISGYSVNYYLYDNPEYVSEGYYSSTVGTTNSKSATFINVDAANATNIDLTLLTGNTISGTISLPNSATVIGNEIYGKVYVDPLNGGNGYYDYFNIPVGENSTNYTVRVPVDTSISGYRVNYYLNNNYSYVREGFYSSSGTTSSNSATLVNANAGNASDTHLTLLTGNTISGTVSLPEGVIAPANGLKLSVSLDPLDGGAPYTTFCYIQPRGTSADYLATVPVNTTGYRVSYELEDNYEGYLNEGYYSTAGTTTSAPNLATLVFVNSGNASDIDLMLLTGNITLPSTITLDIPTATMTVGQTEQLTATIMPNNTTDKSVTWSVFSQNPAIAGTIVASVSETGEVRALNLGTAVIRATSHADTTKYAECIVTVTAAPVVDFLPLSSAITKAQAKHDGATEGLALGQYATGSKLILQTAIEAAQIVLNLSTATAEEVTQATTLLNTAVNIFEAGKIVPDGFSATPVVKIGVNHGAGDIAGMFIGLEDIIDSDNRTPQTRTIAGYQIEVTFDPNLVSISNVLDATNSGELFSKNIEFVDGPNGPGSLGKVSVACASGGSINNYDKLFFIPITLKGSALDPTSISVKYLDIRDASLHNIQIPTLENLKFQRGKIYNRELGKPNIADAVAGLQYLAMLRNPGQGLEDVNLVNMASIIETGATTNVAKANVKDVIALMQYSVNLRDDYFRILPTGRMEFGLGIRNGSLSGKQLRLFDLQSGDQVEVFKGSDNSSLIGPVTVTPTSSNPFVLDNVSFGGELFLKVKVMRGSLVGEEYAFENLSVNMGAIPVGSSTTGISVKGLQAGDQVSLYNESGQQIGDTLSVGASGTVTFSSVSIVENGVKVQINRLTPASSSPQMFYKWGDLITYGVKTEIAADQSETLTVQFLESGDVVNLYDSAKAAVPGKQGLIADAQGQVIFSNLPLAPYYVEVVRGNIHSSRWEIVNPPAGKVTYSHSFMESGSQSGKKLKLYDLQVGDQVEVFKGSDNSAIVSAVTVQSSSPNPLVFDNIEIGSELFLKVRVTRGSLEGVHYVFDNLKISVGKIAVGVNTSINLQGLQPGDQVSLYRESGALIGSTQSVGANSTEITLSGVSVVENGVKVQISRPTPFSYTPSMFYKWGDLITFGTKTELAADESETLTVQFLESGDVVNLYDSNNAAISGRQGLIANVEGRVIISGLPLAPYRVEVLRGGYESRWQTVNPPTVHLNFGLSSWRSGTNSGKQLRLYDLKIGDQVQVFKGSDRSQIGTTVTVQSSGSEPVILDNINMGSELYLIVKVTRGTLDGEKYVFDNLKINMGAITSEGTADTTTITVEGLLTDDKVKLYRESGLQIGATQYVEANSTKVTFDEVDIAENGIRVQIARPNPESSTETMFYKWEDLITYGWQTDISANRLEILTVRGLLSGDVVNLYDSEGDPIAGRQGMPAVDGNVIISGLDFQIYQIEVVRGNIHSRWSQVVPPTPLPVVTQSPVVSGIVKAGDSSISGTATIGACVVLSVNGVNQPAVTADTSGNWTVLGLILVPGDEISVTAQSAGEIASPAYVVTVTALAAPAPIPGTVTGQFELWKIKTTGLSAATDYELRLSDNTIYKITSDVNKSIIFTDTQMEKLALLGVETIEIRLAANATTLASPFVTLLEVGSVGPAPVGITRDPGNDGYNTGNELLMGAESGKYYEIKVDTGAWTGEINNQPHLPVSASGELTALTILAADTPLYARLAGKSYKVPSRTSLVPSDASSTLMASSMISPLESGTQVSSITVNGAGDETSVQEGDTLDMSALVLPEDATDRTLIWSVATLLEGTATINSDTGVLTATGVGTVTVTATSATSGVTGSIVITITAIPDLLEAIDPDPETDIGSGSETDLGTGSETDLGTGSETDLGIGSETDSGSGSGTTSDTGSETDSGTGSDTGTDLDLDLGTDLDIQND